MTAPHCHKTAGFRLRSRRIEVIPDPPNRIRNSSSRLGLARVHFRTWLSSINKRDINYEFA